MGVSCDRKIPFGIWSYMKILVTAKYVSGDAKEGGSSRFMKCVTDALVDMGHDVTATNNPKSFMHEDFDYIICSHHLSKIRGHSAKKVFISHGVIPEESPTTGADRYISISEEVRDYHKKTTGIDSDVVYQPIFIRPPKMGNDELQNILIIRQNPIEEDPFAFLSQKYNVKISDIEKPIEDQIDWADLCITLGRGALESMAQGKPVIVADKRFYMGAFGDGYVTWENLTQIARCNFSGRRYRNPVTRKWLEQEIAKYDPLDAGFLYKYVKCSHDAKKICTQYLDKKITPVKINDYTNSKMAFGVMVNDLQRLDMVLRQSAIGPKIECHTIKNPYSATKGLNKLLDIIEKDGNEIAVLTHQDMYYRQGWTDSVKEQLSLLPGSWVVAGIIGKDMDGMICGKLQDMRVPLRFNTCHLHEFPHPVCCFDECCLIINLKSGFRFDESVEGFDLYGTLSVLQAWETGGSAWVIDAYAEHYCSRPFTWVPDQLFRDNYKMLHDRFKTIESGTTAYRKRLDSTAIGLPKEAIDKIAFMTSAE